MTSTSIASANQNNSYVTQQQNNHSVSTITDVNRQPQVDVAQVSQYLTSLLLGQGSQQSVNANEFINNNNGNIGKSRSPSNLMSEPLCYRSEVHYTIREHLVELVKEFPSLRCSCEPYTHNDGHVARLLTASGTIPIVFQGQKYNIPIAIWLTEGYPYSKPTCYVTPTRNMIIRPGHGHVDGSGLVSSRILSEWRAHQSKLFTLVKELCSIFSLDPPLYTKPPGYDERSFEQQQRSPSINNNSTPYNDNVEISNFSTTNISSMFKVLPTTEVTQQQQQQQPHANLGGNEYRRGVANDIPNCVEQSNANIYTNVAGASSMNANYSAQQERQTTGAELFRDRAIATISNRIRAVLECRQSDLSTKLSTCLETQRQLINRHEQMQDGLRRLQTQSERLDFHVSAMKADTTAIDMWLMENESNADDDDSQIDPDLAIVGDSSKIDQLIDAMAEDAAIEDILYVLEKAVQNGKVDFETYMKNVRSLCREQFFSRAICVKIKNELMQTPKINDQNNQNQGWMPSVSPGGGMPRAFPPSTRDHIAYPRVNYG